MLRSNLERLKSSLLGMLNVLIFAEQLRNRDTLPASVLKGQREPLNALDEEKRANDARFGKVLKALENLQADESITAAARAHFAQQNTMLQANQALPASQPNGKDLRTTYGAPDDVPRLPPALSYREKEIRHHCALVTRLVQEVSAVQYQIGHGLRDWMQKGVLGIHWKEWSSLRKQCGDEELLGLFSSHPDVVHFWRTQIEENWRPGDHTAMQIRRSPVPDGGDLRTTYVIAETHALDVSPSAYSQPVSQAWPLNALFVTTTNVPHLEISPISEYTDCNRSTDLDFSRKENLNEHVRRRHGNQIPSVNDASAQTTASLNVPTSAEPDVLAGKHPTESADLTGEVNQDDLMSAGQPFHRQWQSEMIGTKLQVNTANPAVYFYTGKWQDPVMPCMGSGRGRKRSRGPELEEDETRQRYSGEPKRRLQSEISSEFRKVPQWETDFGSFLSWDRIDQMILSKTTISKEEILSSHWGEEWSPSGRAQAASDVGATVGETRVKGAPMDQPPSPGSRLRKCASTR